MKQELTRALPICQRYLEGLLKQLETMDVSEVRSFHIFMRSRKNAVILFFISAKKMCNNGNFFQAQRPLGEQACSGSENFRVQAKGSQWSVNATASKGSQLLHCPDISKALKIQVILEVGGVPSASCTAFLSNLDEWDDSLGVCYGQNNQSAMAILMPVSGLMDSSTILKLIDSESHT